MSFRHLSDSGMDWPAWITAIATVGLALGVAVALFSLWDARKTRDGQLVTDIARRWSDPDMVGSLREFSEYGPTGLIELLERVYEADPTKPAASRGDLDLLYRLLAFPDLIEMIGVLVSEKAISTDVVYKMWGPQIITAWDSWRQPVARLRELEGYSITFRYFEKLVEQMNSRHRKLASGTAAI